MSVGRHPCCVISAISLSLLSFACDGSSLTETNIRDSEEHRDVASTSLKIKCNESDHIFDDTTGFSAEATSLSWQVAADVCLARLSNQMELHLQSRIECDQSECTGNETCYPEILIMRSRDDGLFCGRLIRQTPEDEFPLKPTQGLDADNMGPPGFVRCDCFASLNGRQDVYCSNCDDE